MAIQGQQVKIEFQTDEGWKDITDAASEVKIEAHAAMKDILPPLGEPIEITVTIDNEIVYDYVETEDGHAIPIPLKGHDG